MMRNDLIQTIFSRRSIRKYTKEPVPEDVIKTLLEAAMAAPSAHNWKPWHFVVITERETLDQLANAHKYAKMLHEAPLCISVCGDESVSPHFWEQDCSAATQNILLSATALGLGSVWCGVYPGEDRSRTLRVISEILGIEGSFKPLNLIAIGYPAEEKEPRTQYDESRVHSERW
jgi:nitroreductase